MRLARLLKVMSSKFVTHEDHSTFRKDEAESQLILLNWRATETEHLNYDRVLGVLVPRLEVVGSKNVMIRCSTGHVSCCFCTF
jgi:hypothetical protein